MVLGILASQKGQVRLKQLSDFTLINAVISPIARPVVPLGPLYLVSVLENNGYSVDFRDYEVGSHRNPLSVENFVSFATKTANVLGISCYYNLLPLVLLSVREIKRKHPGLTVVLGGPGPSVVSQKILEKFPFVDVIVKGEGERTVVELLQALTGDDKPLSDVKGISYRRGNKIYLNPPRERIKDLDEIPFPAYHRIKVTNYREFGIITSRGCPFNCAFCQVSPLWGRYNTRRSIENVIEEIALLYKKYGITRVNIFDDLFTLHRKRVLDFCKNLKKEHLDIEWFCLSRVDAVDEEMLKKMAESGCTAIQYGVESGSNKILDLISKGFTRETAEDTIRKSLKYMKTVVTDFIWGFPFETMDDFFETIFFMSRLSKIGCIVDHNVLTPCTLSRLYNEYRKSIRFDERLCRDHVWKRHPEWDRQHIIKLIKQHPDVFPDFYYYDSDTLFQKYNLLQRAGWLFVKLGSLIDTTEREGP